METECFSAKVETYFFELGRWLVSCVPSVLYVCLLWIVTNLTFILFFVQESVAEYIVGPSNIVAAKHKMYFDDFTSECDMAVSHDWAVSGALYFALCTVLTNTAL